MSERKSVQYFNRGVVWGRVSGIKHDKAEGTGTPFLAITIETPNELYGNIRTYGRLWGRDKIAAFEDHHKKHPGEAYRFEGFFDQYEKGDERYSNYTFFQWQHLPDGFEYRAAFVLTGTIEFIRDDLFGLHVVRSGVGDREDTEQHYEFYVLDAQKLAGIFNGDNVKVKGVIRYKDPHDYFGDVPEGPVRPYCMGIEKVKEKEKF